MPQFPYATTLAGLNTTLGQLRSNFPAKVDADTLKMWDIAANNESSILATLRFVGLIDAEGKRAGESPRVFSFHDDSEFAPAFAALVKTAYEKLFEIYGDKAWTLDKGKLISFFRQSDQTSARVGEQQAATFTALAAHAGYTGAPRTSNGAGAKPPRPSGRGANDRGKTAKPVAAPAAPAPIALESLKGGAALSVAVRIELNLPVSEKQEVYDNIFRSIRENLINA